MSVGIKISIQRATSVFLLCGLVFASSCKKSAEQHITKGAEYVEANRNQEALLEFRSAAALAPQNADIKFRLARTYRSLGNLPAAIEEFQGVLALEPNHVEAKVNLANLFLRSGADSKADPLIKEALRSKPDHAVAHSLRGQYLIRSGDLKNGLLELEAAVRLSPTDVELYEPIATFHSSKGKPELALDILTRCVNVNPKSIPAILNLAQFQYLQGRVEDAEVYVRRALSIDNRHLKANLVLAQVLTVTSRHQDAESVLRTVKEIAPNDPVAYRALSVFYETTGQRGKAIAELTALEKTQFRDLIVKQRLVENLLAAGRLEDADGINQSLKKASPKAAYPHYTEGRIHMSRQQFQAAITSFNLAISIEARPEYYHHLGMAQASVGMAKQARESLQQALSQDPRRVDSILGLATLAIGAGSPAFALTAADRVLKAYPKSAEAHIVRAQALRSVGRLEEAERTVQDVLAANNVAIPALGLLVDLKVSQGKGREVEERLSALLASNPSIPELHLLLGIARYARKDLVGSEQSLREAIRLKPSVKAAHQLLANVLEERGDRAGSKKALQGAIEAEPGNLSNYLRLAAEWEKDKRVDEAIATLAAGRKVDPSSPILANQYAYLLLESGGDVNVALALAQQAKEKMPTSPEVADTLGWAYHKRGMHDQAIRQFKLAIQAKPSEPAFHYHLAEAYSALGNWGEAKRALSKSLSSPVFPDRAKAEAAAKRIPQ